MPQFLQASEAFKFFMSLTDFSWFFTGLNAVRRVSELRALKLAVRPDNGALIVTGQSRGDELMQVISRSHKTHQRRRTFKHIAGAFVG